jgi:hypothetical protein
MGSEKKEKKGKNEGNERQKCKINGISFRFAVFPFFSLFVYFNRACARWQSTILMDASEIV